MYRILWNKIFPDFPVETLAGLYLKGKWIKEPNYQLKQFKFNLDIALSGDNLWRFLNGGNPKPKMNVKIKSQFQIGDKDDYKGL